MSRSLTLGTRVRLVAQTRGGLAALLALMVVALDVGPGRAAPLSCARLEALCLKQVETRARISGSAPSIGYGDAGHGQVSQTQCEALLTEALASGTWPAQNGVPAMRCTP